MNSIIRISSGRRCQGLSGNERRRKIAYESEGGRNIAGREVRRGSVFRRLMLSQWLRGGICAESLTGGRRGHPCRGQDAQPTARCTADSPMSGRRTCPVNPPDLKRACAASRNPAPGSVRMPTFAVRQVPATLYVFFTKCNEHVNRRRRWIGSYSVRDRVERPGSGMDSHRSGRAE